MICTVVWAFERFARARFCRAQIEVDGVKYYTFNAFFMTMRGKFTTPGTSIHYYVVEFDPSTLAWEDFRGKVLGPTDPKDAPAGALRGIIAGDWKALGLAAPCNGRSFSTFSWVASAPWRTRYSAMARAPLSSPNWRGVLPLWSLALVSAPRRVRYSVMGRSFLLAASKSGVSPFLSLT